jgi:thiamine-monophosphate kinase
VRVSDLGEFGLIARIERAAAHSARAPHVRVGIGDDAAVLRTRAGEETVVSTDAFVEDVHFRWRTTSARTVGRRAAVAALSDLAAMGARPTGVTFALALPPTLPLARFDGLVHGLLEEATTYACPLVGGNVTRARETQLVLTAFGAVRRGRALLRRARVGDRVCVTGTLGGSALQTARAERGLGRVRRVAVPRVAAGQALARLPAVHGCIDVSDGLLADLAHLLGPDRHLELDPRSVPRPRGLAAACRRLDLDPDALVLTGGEDYELLFAVGARGPTAAALGRRLGVPVSELGRVRRGPPAPGPGGWRHL